MQGHINVGKDVNEKINIFMILLSIAAVGSNTDKYEYYTSRPFISLRFNELKLGIYIKTCVGVIQKYLDTGW